MVGADRSGCFDVRKELDGPSAAVVAACEDLFHERRNQRCTCGAWMCAGGMWPGWSFSVREWCGMSAHVETQPVGAMSGLVREQLSDAAEEQRTPG